MGWGRPRTPSDQKTERKQLSQAKMKDRAGSQSRQAGEYNLATSQQHHTGQLEHGQAEPAQPQGPESDARSGKKRVRKPTRPKATPNKYYPPYLDFPQPVVDTNGRQVWEVNAGRPV
ncbi:hypothetical protein HYFRA_00002240 [Hymenoscyphus fraxineus]|uniref:Uncharacterized protein n=1 Tax=Hymenoscyphus fraxineus TaxID=746836 RepID=A0A9N9KLF9_9HELO|nr:hypothetical protein HYFRA_00002240 [Hymenoscyphus fraxineus]